MQISDPETVWVHPTRRGVEIRLEGPVATLLADSSLRAFTAANQREIGGFLLGTATLKGSEVSFVVTDMQFVTAEGPRFHATVKDENDLITVLNGSEKAAGRPDGCTPIGYFRTEFEEGLSLTEREKTFVERHLPARPSVAFIIQRFGSNVCKAGISLQENGAFEHSTGFEMLLYGSDRSRKPTGAAGGMQYRWPEPVPAPPSRFSRLAMRVELAQGWLVSALSNGHKTAREMPAGLPNWNLRALKPIAAAVLGCILAVGLFYTYASSAHVFKPASSSGRSEVKAPVRVPARPIATKPTVVLPKVRAAAPPEIAPKRPAARAARTREHNSVRRQRLPSPAGAAEKEADPPAPRHSIVYQSLPKTEVQPALPAGLSKDDLAGARVAIQVAVDSSGNVTGTHVTESSDGRATQVCTQAARRWKFRPASVNGKPITSSYTIVFTF